MQGIGGGGDFSSPVLDKNAFVNLLNRLLMPFAYAKRGLERSLTRFFLLASRTWEYFT